MIDYTNSFHTIDWQGLLKSLARVCNVYTMLSNCLLLLYYEADPRKTRINSGSNYEHFHLHSCKLPWKGRKLSVLTHTSKHEILNSSDSSVT